MITFFNNIKENWIVKFLLFLVSISMLGLFGLGSMTSMWGRDQTAIRVGNSTVKGQELLDSVQKDISLMTTTKPVTVKEAVEKGFLDKAIKTSTNSLLYQSMMDDLGLIASHKAVGNYIVNNALFQTTAGSFDRGMMMAYLQRMRMSEDEFAHALQEKLAHNHLTDAIKAVVVVPNYLKEKMFDYTYETRDLDVLLVNPESVEIKKTPDEKTLKEYYDAMEDQLYAPEYRKISILKITPEDVSKGVVVDEEELKQAYEDNKDRYVKPEQRRVEQILVQDEEQANALFEELTEYNFATIAKEKAGEDNVDLGWIEKKGVVEEVGEAVFNAKINEVLAPVKSDFGYHILIVREVKAGEETKFEDAKEELAKSVRAKQAYDLLYKKNKEINEILGEGNSLAEAAKRTGLTLEEAIYIDAAGMDKNGKASELPTMLVQDVFLSKTGDATALVDYKDGYIVAEVLDVESSYLRPFDAVKKELIAEWKKDQQKAEVDEFVQKILTGAQKDKLLKTVALVYNLKEETFDETKRSDIADLDSDKIETLFNAKEGDIFSMETAEDNYIIVQVKKVTPADKTDAAAQMNVVIDLKQNLTEVLEEELLSYYYKKENVQINQQVIDETFKPYMTEQE